MPDVDSKVCTKCEKELQLSEFHKHQSGKYGVRSQCKACVKAYNTENRDSISEYHRQYRQDHLERKRAQDKARYWANRDSALEYAKTYREAHREEAAEYHRQYREKHRESLLEADRKRYWDNREERSRYARERYLADRESVIARVERWRELHPEKWLEVQRRRRARVREATVVKFSSSDLSLRMSYFGNKCWMCSGPFEHIDHVKPISKGGSHMLSNLRPACRGCNSSKSAKWPFTLEDATWLCP